MAESGCSADQGYFLRHRSVNNGAPLCSCAIRFASRTASGIATGASSRTSAWRAEAWSRSMCCTGRDQRHARTGVAALDRSVGRGGGSAEDAISVSRRSLRGASARRLDRSTEPLAASPLSSTSMGRLLAGAEPVGGVAARSVLGRAVAEEPQGHALGSGAVRAGRLSPAGASPRASPIGAKIGIVSLNLL